MSANTDCSLIKLQIGLKITLFSLFHVNALFIKLENFNINVFIMYPFYIICIQKSVDYNIDNLLCYYYSVHLASIILQYVYNMFTIIKKIIFK